MKNPKEEQKQHLIDMIKADEELGLYEEPKQETTPEEIAEYLGFVKGAKWQQEQDNNKYSEEEVLELLLKMNEWLTTFDGEEDVKEWFEQFKKK